MPQRESPRRKIGNFMKAKIWKGALGLTGALLTLNMGCDQKKSSSAYASGADSKLDDIRYKTAGAKIPQYCGINDETLTQCEGETVCINGICEDAWTMERLSFKGDSLVVSEPRRYMLTFLGQTGQFDDPAFGILEGFYYVKLFLNDQIQPGWFPLLFDSENVNIASTILIDNLTAGSDLAFEVVDEDTFNPDQIAYRCHVAIDANLIRMASQFVLECRDGLPGQEYRGPVVKFALKPLPQMQTSTELDQQKP